MKLQPKDIHEQMRSDVMQWAGKIRVKPRQVRIQDMTKKWASCSAQGTVTFSTDLLSEPPPFREVVVVHELLHLIVPNHGKLFKSLLNAYVPGWEKRVGRPVSRLCGTDAH